MMLGFFRDVAAGSPACPPEPASSLAARPGAATAIAERFRNSRRVAECGWRSCFEFVIDFLLLRRLYDPEAGFSAEPGRQSLEACGSQHRITVTKDIFRQRSISPAAACMVWFRGLCPPGTFENISPTRKVQKELQRARKIYAPAPSVLLAISGFGISQFAREYILVSRRASKRKIPPDDELPYLAKAARTHRRILLWTHPSPEVDSAERKASLVCAYRRILLEGARVSAVPDAPGANSDAFCIAMVRDCRIRPRVPF